MTDFFFSCLLPSPNLDIGGSILSMSVPVSPKPNPNHTHTTHHTANQAPDKTDHPNPVPA